MQTTETNPTAAELAEENDVCARLLANDLAMRVAAARLLAEMDPEPWDGLS